MPKNSSWTKSKIIAFIRDCVTQGIPVGKIWQVASSPTSTAIKEFGSWRAALEAAGFQSVHQKWSRERVLSEIRARYPHEKKIWQNFRCLPAAAKRYFGTWGKALVVAGFRSENQPPTRKGWTPEQVLDAIRERQQRGCLLSTCKEDRSLYVLAQRYFGRWLNAVRAAGIAVKSQKYLSAEEVLNELRSRHSKGMTFAGISVLSRPLYRSVMHWYGNLHNALIAAGIESRSRNKWEQRSVIAAILARREQGQPLYRVWKDDKPLFKAATNHFGNWQNALIAAGIPVKLRRFWSKELILEEMQNWKRRGYERVRLEDPTFAEAAARLFGTLLIAWEEAGLEPPLTRWTKRRIIQRIQNHYVRGKRIHINGCGDKILAEAAKRHFGTWRSAVEAAGLGARLPQPVMNRIWSPAAVIAALQAGSPDGKHASRVWKTDTGLYSIAKKHFGSWRAAVLAAGLLPQQKQWSREAVVLALQQRHSNGQSLSSGVISKEDSSLAGAVWRYFRSWRRAYQAAGFTAAQTDHLCRLPREK